MEIMSPDDVRERRTVYATLQLFDYAGRPEDFAHGEAETLRHFYCLAQALLTHLPHGAGRERLLETLLEAQRMAKLAFMFPRTREE